MSSTQSQTPSFSESIVESLGGVTSIINDCPAAYTHPLASVIVYEGDLADLSVISSTRTKLLGEVPADLSRSQLLDADSINIFKSFHESDRRLQDAIQGAVQRMPTE